ncbi:hypothetical protein QQ045_010012 [Rhodiola kirilowii]
MPKSKRSRQVTLSKTNKKGREHKEVIVNTIREAAENYNSAYVFTFENMRNLKFKEFREQLKATSRSASIKLCKVALGQSESDEIRPGIYNVSKLLHGDAGLVFTNMPKGDVERLFNEYEESDFAWTGSIASETVELKEGPLEQFTHEMEPFLRKLGMPVKLNKGVIELVADYVICEEGKPVSPEASHILICPSQTDRLLGAKMATFKLHLVCRWSLEDFDLYKQEPTDAGDAQVVPKVKSEHVQVEKRPSSW